GRFGSAAAIGSRRPRARAPATGGRARAAAARPSRTPRSAASAGAQGGPGDDDLLREDRAMALVPNRLVIDGVTKQETRKWGYEVRLLRKGEVVGGGTIIAPNGKDAL